MLQSAPRASGWSSDSTPFPFAVVITGAPQRLGQRANLGGCACGTATGDQQWLLGSAQQCLSLVQERGAG